jgi:hypothetical protein
MAASLRELLGATPPHPPRCARHPLPRGKRGKPARSRSRDRFPTRHRDGRAAARGDLALATAFHLRHREGCEAARGVDLEPLSPRGRGAGVRGLVAHGRIAARAAPCDTPSPAALRAAPSPARGEGKAGAIRFSRPLPDRSARGPLGDQWHGPGTPLPSWERGRGEGAHSAWPHRCASCSVRHPLTRRAARGTLSHEGRGESRRDPVLATASQRRHRERPAGPRGDLGFATASQPRHREGRAAARGDLEPAATAAWRLSPRIRCH